MKNWNGRYSFILKFVSHLLLTHMLGDQMNKEGWSLLIKHIFPKDNFMSNASIPIYAVLANYEHT